VCLKHRNVRREIPRLWLHASGKGVRSLFHLKNASRTSVQFGFQTRTRLGQHQGDVPLRFDSISFQRDEIEEWRAAPWKR
jgi:hypothetical protein